MPVDRQTPRFLRLVELVEAAMDAVDRGAPSRTLEEQITAEFGQHPSLFGMLHSDVSATYIAERICLYRPAYSGALTVDELAELVEMNRGFRGSEADVDEARDLFCRAIRHPNGGELISDLSLTPLEAAQRGMNYVGILL